ncbi:type III pantothenate kinase [Desulfosediminicola flagellatus]|uniref:type III pantothenate kinase n=1 Tax=Desulfosediminicola flagellatus TaxID=2569541 RepID=UPI0010AD4F20|nr:type III pantothenate kinase [Desulfosediminicola flagellatus]
MLFVIDVGNSHTVTGLYSGDDLIGKWRLKSDRKMTADELAIQYHTLFAMEKINTEEIHGVVLASVVPTLEAAWHACFQNHLFGHLTVPILVVSNVNVSDMIDIQLPNPAEIGADRLVNAIAAYKEYPCNLVVVDFGTAITFDCVTAQCEYLGGAILPGVAVSLEALSSKTAKLPHIDVSKGPKNIIGKSTIEAMKSGILYGYGAMLDGMIAGIKKEMHIAEGTELHVIATGGMASLISPYASVIDTIDPLLTLKGLKIIYNEKVSS